MVTKCAGGGCPVLYRGARWGAEMVVIVGPGPVSFCVYWSGVSNPRGALPRESASGCVVASWEKEFEGLKGMD